MNLTALIAELFVGGILCLLWLALLFSAYFDTRVLVAFLKDNPLGGPAMFSVITYALGVIFDRVWDAALKRFDDGIEARYFPAKEDLRAVRRRIFGKEKNGADFIDYIRSRMRIVRACLCNGVLLGIAGCIFYARTVPAATPGGFSRSAERPCSFHSCRSLP